MRFYPNEKVVLEFFINYFEKKEDKKNIDTIKLLNIREIYEKAIINAFVMEGYGAVPKNKVYAVNVACSTLRYAYKSFKDRESTEYNFDSQFEEAAINIKRVEK